MNKNLIEKIAPQLTELMIKKMETLTEAWRKPWSISGQGDVTDFSSFKYLFENNVLTGESQWSVRECAYNPTYQDMKNGKYKQ